MAGRLWAVIGGGDKGGILVREGVDIASAQLPERLSTHAVVRELKLEGDRLQYERLAGSGPATGWVSIRLTGKELLVEASLLWEVVGGGASGGILVRKGIDTTSDQYVERLSTGAVIRELALEGGRLNFSRITGSGPATGWVSLKLESGKDLVAKYMRDKDFSAPPAEAPAAPAPEPYLPQPPLETVLEVSMRNEEKDFSYEGLPAWVPKHAAVAKLRREGKPYYPPPYEAVERLAKMGQLQPFKKLSPKKIKEAFKQNLPGSIYGLSFPHTVDQMLSKEFGAEWLTKALHAAGTLPEDNRVSKLVRCEELPIKGLDTAGGAAMKAFITVEYEKPDPELHTELLAKYTYDPNRNIPGVTMIGNDDASEVLAAALAHHLLPFRAPKFYWADICRETTAYMIIMETIPYGKRGQEASMKPYEIMPGCGKYQDYLLPQPEQYYCCLFRAMGQMAGWDKQHRFDGFMGPAPWYTEEMHLANHPNRTRSAQQVEMTKQVFASQLDKGIEFCTKYARHMMDDDLRDEKKMAKMKEEVLEMCPWQDDVRHYEAACSDWVAASHVNLQADNAWFWKDEYGEMNCGVLDWSGFMRYPYCRRWIGCLSGADAEVMIAHEEAIVRNFCEEYARCGGPRLPVEQELLRYRVIFATSIFDASTWLERQMWKETSAEELLTMKSMQDDKLQERFYTRCAVGTLVNTYALYVKAGHYKRIFEDWKKGAGKRYLANLTN